MLIYMVIPVDNIGELKILNALVPDVLKDSVEEIRSGYVKLNKPLEEISQIVLNDEKIQLMSQKLESEMNDYISNHWNELRNITSESNLKVLEDNMLGDIKEIL